MSQQRVVFEMGIIIKKCSGRMEGDNQQFQEFEK